jgi:hypothetical protein
MENRIVLSGEVQRSSVYDTYTEVELLVRASPDLVLHFLGPQVIPVRIPDSVMVPNEIPPGTFLRVHGLLVSNRSAVTLADFVQEVAPGLDALVEWGVDPHSVQHAVSFAHVRALRLARRPSDEGLNLASIEGRIVSRPRLQPGGRAHLRLYNYPDEPIGLYADGKEQVVYGTISLDRAMQLPLRQHIRIPDGMVCSYVETESLGYFVARHGLNVVWPAGFDPRAAKKAVTSLAIAANKVYQVELPRMVGAQRVEESSFLDAVDSEDLAQYDDSASSARPEPLQGRSVNGKAR